MEKMDQVRLISRIQRQCSSSSCHRPLQHGQELHCRQAERKCATMKRSVQVNVEFTLRDEIGRGTFGKVYLGKFQGKWVAIKEIRLTHVNKAETDREVHAMAQLHHGNVLKLHCSMSQNGCRYLILELCVATLSDRFDGKYQGPMPDDASALHQMAAGVHHIHSAGLVHRDIKPANVLVSRSICLKISDFGYCKRTGERGSYSLSGIKGTPNYLAPELLVFSSDRSDALPWDSQRHARPRATIASDIFALGCVYYKHLTNGRHPFGEEEVLANIFRGISDLSQLAGEHFALQIIGPMIDHEPANRPSAADIESLLRSRLQSTEAQQPDVTKTRRVVLMARRIKRNASAAVHGLADRLRGTSHQQRTTGQPTSENKRKLTAADSLADSLQELSIQQAKRPKLQLTTLVSSF